MNIEDAQMLNDLVEHIDSYLADQQDAIDELRTSLEAAQEYFTNIIKEISRDIN